MLLTTVPTCSAEPIQGHAVVGLCTTAMQCAAIIAPLAAFQLSGWLQFCNSQRISAVPAWCTARVPYIYGYVQSHYWGIGLFKYWHISQACPPAAD